MIYVTGEACALLDICIQKFKNQVKPKQKNMFFQHIYDKSLAQASYFIGCQKAGVAIVIDPKRDVDTYLEIAKQNKMQITHVTETHIHADFLSGSRELAALTGAKLYLSDEGGKGWEYEFDHEGLKDGSVFMVGNLKFEVMHTPGHTPESISFLLTDTPASLEPVMLFTGDFVFVGDIGRPDLLEEAAGLVGTKEAGAHQMYKSINRFNALNDFIQVWPGHGAGSACGKNMSKETTDLLGNQKKTNYALRADMTKEEFIKEVTDGLLPPPAYFPLNVMMNIHGYDSIDKVLERGQQALDPAAFEMVANDSGALVLDTRDPQTFAKGFIPNAINIGIDGNFAPWVGAMIPDIKQQILLVTDEGREEEVITRLARVGYDFTIGYLKDGFKSWKDAGMEVDSIKSISANELAEIMSNEEINLIDVRKDSEFQSEHVEIAENLPLDYINDAMPKIDKSKTYYVHCAGGYRSMIFNSTLRARGFDNLIDVAGGFKAIQEVDSIKKTAFVCPSTLK